MDAALAGVLNSRPLSEMRRNAMQMILAVAAGGAAGAVARYLVMVQATRLLGMDFPWGTLTVNIVGSFRCWRLRAT